MSILSKSIAQEYWVKKIQDSTPITLFHNKQEQSNESVEGLNIKIPIPANNAAWIEKISGG